MAHPPADAAPEGDIPARTHSLYRALRVRGVPVVRLGPRWLRIPGCSILTMGDGRIRWRTAAGGPADAETIEAAVELLAEYQVIRRAPWGCRP